MAHRPRCLQLCRTGHGYSQGKAYRAAGYLAKPGASADSAASSRLRKFKGILDRVRELVAEANARNQHNVDLSRERIGRDLDHADEASIALAIEANDAFVDRLEAIRAAA